MPPTPLVTTAGYQLNSLTSLGSGKQELLLGLVVHASVPCGWEGRGSRVVVGLVYIANSRPDKATEETLLQKNGNSNQVCFAS